MYVFLNSDSLEGQAEHIYHASELILEMMEACELLLEIGASRERAYRDSEFQDKSVAPETTLADCVRFQFKQLTADHATSLAARQTETTSEIVLMLDRFRSFVRLLTQTPFAFEAVGQHKFECERDKEGIAHKALGYASHFTQQPFEGTGGNAVIVSLGNSTAYSAQYIDTWYMNDSLMEERSVWNVTRKHHIQQVRRIFDVNPKHPPTNYTDDEYISKMDLLDDEAQYVLDRAIQLPNEDRVFARYNGHIYVFALHDPARRLYHGFRIKAANLRARDGQIYAQLRKHCDWAELQ